MRQKCLVLIHLISERNLYRADTPTFSSVLVLLG